MLCTACQNKSRCVAAQLAQGDAEVAKLLHRLQRCTLRTAPPSLGQRLKALVRGCGNPQRPRLRA